MIKLHKPQFRLRTILLIVNLFVLIVPFGSIYIFRLYENELVRQTESELVVQGAYIGALYKQKILPLLKDADHYGTNAVPQTEVDSKYHPIAPTLNLTSSTVASPPRPDAVPTDAKPDTAAMLAGAAIYPVVEEATFTTLSGVRLMDYQGIVVAGHDEVGLSLAASEEVSEALKGKYSAMVRQRFSKHPLPSVASISRGTGIRIFVAMPIIHNQHVIGAVLLSRSPRNIMNGLYDERESVMTVACIIIAMAVLLAWLTSYAISRPIYALIGQAQSVARGEKGSTIAEPVTQELALLSQSIFTMAETIAARSDYIRNFAMHVSHEFKTPLTAIQGAIELIQEHGNSMPPEQLARFLANTVKDTERLRQLVSRLLELARADVLQPREEHSSLPELLGGDNALPIAGNIPAIVLPLPGDIAQTALGNLFENSRQHGATEMRISAQQRDGRMTLTLHDNGRGITEANLEKLFTPFFTTKREQGGTGLGLVIVRSLLAAYHMDIKPVTANAGACFELSWSV